MNTYQRRDLIVQKILEQGRVQISDLVQEFELTDTSIRNDLTILEEKGLLRRVHGGAVSTSRSIQLAAYNTRMEHNREQKARIASVAAARLNPVDIILLDSGTTVQYLARQIPAQVQRSGRLRIVTNSIPILEEIGGWAPHNLLMLGGIFLPEHQATVGPETLHGLEQITATTAFLGCDGLTIDGGITSAHPLVAEVGRMMADRAEQVIVLADSSKLERAGFVPIIPLEDIDLLITDNESSSGVVEDIRLCGIEVLTVWPLEWLLDPSRAPGSISRRSCSSKVYWRQVGLGYLDLIHIDKSYAGVHAMRDFSLSVIEGQFVSLLGPSGSGKTTTLRMVAGFERPDAGEILLDGDDLTSIPPNIRGAGMVFQAYALLPNLSVQGNIAFGLEIAWRPKLEIRAAVSELLQLVRLEGIEDRFPFQLSGGQQQRVPLARALALKPRLLLLDEPLSALDAKVRVSLRAEIRRIQSELGLTTIYVTHDQEEALSISDRVVVMHGGSIEQDATPTEIYRQPAWLSAWI